MISRPMPTSKASWAVQSNNMAQTPNKYCQKIQTLNLEPRSQSTFAFPIWMMSAKRHFYYR